MLTLLLNYGLFHVNSINYTLQCLSASSQDKTRSYVTFKLGIS